MEPASGVEPDTEANRVAVVSSSAQSDPKWWTEGESNPKHNWLIMAAREGIESPTLGSSIPRSATELSSDSLK